jgi:glutamine synthetase
VRVEYRAADAACNPYLTLSVLLAAGLAGIRERYELPPEIAANLQQMTPAERAAAGAKRLPETLSEALDIMERSELVAEALGEHVFDWFLRNKRAEWDAYQQHVSRFELESYLPIL